MSSPRVVDCPAIDTEPVDDAALLARHVAGDPAAFGEIVARHRDRLWAVALRTLGDPDDAADAVQDALLSAFRHARGFRGGAAVTTWLHRIVVNACIDLARRRATHPARPVADLPEFGGRDEAADRDIQLAMLAGLRALVPEQAAAIVLVDIEGFSVAEAAEILEVPAGTVKSRCARGRAQLAQLLGSPTTAGSGNDTAAAPVQPVGNDTEDST